VTENDIETTWKKQAPSSGFESILWNEDLQTERVVLFIGIYNWPYVGIHGNWKRQSWSHVEEETFFFTIQIDNFRF
jgi:hypothetical protein